MQVSTSSVTLWIAILIIQEHFLQHIRHTSKTMICQDKHGLFSNYSYLYVYSFSNGIKYLTCIYITILGFVMTFI